MMKLHLATRHTQSLKKFNRVLKMKAIIFQKKERNVQLIKVCTATSNWWGLMFHFKFDLYFKVSNKRFFEYVTVVTRTMTQLNSQNTPLKIELTYHQSQLNICCWNKVPLGHKKEVGYMEPLRGSKRQTW